jgi:hypothetical protein
MAGDVYRDDTDGETEWYREDPVGRGLVYMAAGGENKLKVGQSAVNNTCRSRNLNRSFKSSICALNHKAKFLNVSWLPQVK